MNSAGLRSSAAVSRWRKTSPGTAAQRGRSGSLALSRFVGPLGKDSRRAGARIFAVGSVKAAPGFARARALPAVANASAAAAGFAWVLIGKRWAITAA